MTCRQVSLYVSACLIFMIVLPSGRIFATETNEVFVRQSLESFFTEAFDGLPFNGKGSMLIELEKPDLDNLNVSGSALHDVLKRRGVEPSAESDSVSAIRLRFNLSEVKFFYENEGGGIFSRGDLFRVLKVAGDFSVMRNRSSVSEAYLTREYREEIDLADVERLQSDFSPLFSAELPPGPVQRLWEPMIVTSVVGGLVYLFFSSR